MRTFIPIGGIDLEDSLVLDKIDDIWNNPYLWIPTALYADELALKIRDKYELP
jgi:hypothetical protein